MRELDYEREVRAMPLLEALLAARVPVATVDPDGRVVLDVAEGDASFDAAVDAIIKAHDVATIDAAEALARTRYQQDIANIKAFMQATNSSITHLQLVAIVKALVRVLYRVLTDLKD